MLKAPIIGIKRLCMGTDGHGITTLVAFHDCPLRCKFCLNPHSWKDEASIKLMTSEKVLYQIQKDELYFLATKGGVSFGGGEPLLRAEFIKEVIELGANKWNITVETSLNVPRENIEIILPYINDFIIDIKDMNDSIYYEYTGSHNQLVKSNLKWLVKQGKSDHIKCRIPLIPNFNSREDLVQSKQELLTLGINNFEFLQYIINIPKFRNTLI